MTEFLNDWGLILTIFLPLVGALVMMAVPKESEGTIKAVALGTSLLAALVALGFAIYHARVAARLSSR